MKTELYTADFEANAPLRVDSIHIEWLDDESPDISWLGEYSDSRGLFGIERENIGSGEYRYFNPGSVEPFKPDATWIPARIKNKERYWRKTMLRQSRQDFERAEAFNHGHWNMLGCRAVAEVSYPYGNGSRRLESFESGGLWGIESDSDKAWKAEIEAEQLNELKEHLAQFGIAWPIEPLAKAA